MSGTLNARLHRCEGRPRWGSSREDGVGIPTLALFYHPDQAVLNNGPWNNTCVGDCPFHLDAWMRHHTELNDHVFLVEGSAGPADGLGTACLQRATDLCINHVELLEPPRAGLVDIVMAALPRLDWLFAISVARYALMALVVEFLEIDAFVWLDVDVLAFTPSQRLYEEFAQRQHHELAYCVVPGCEGGECLPLANNLFSLFTRGSLLDVVSFIENSLFSLEEEHPVLDSDMHLLFSYAASAAQAASRPFCVVAADEERCRKQARRLEVPDSVVARYLVGNTCAEWGGGVSLDSFFYGYGYMTRYGGLQVVWRQGLPYVIPASGSSATPRRLWSLHFNGASKFLMDFYSRPRTFYNYSHQDFCACATVACADCADPWHFRDHCIAHPRWAEEVVNVHIYPEYERYVAHLLNAGQMFHKLETDRRHIKWGLLAAQGKASAESSVVDQFVREGFVPVASQFGLEAAVGVRDFLDRLWAQRPGFPVVTLEVSKGMYQGRLNSSRMLLTRAPSSVRAMPYRMYVPVLVPELRPILYNESLLDVLRDLVAAFGARGRCEFYPTRGLLFERGSQQDVHDDVWYGLAHTTPGGTLGVWFAFDDVDMDNGPLVYLAGSHLRSEEPFDTSLPGRRERLSLPSALPRVAMEAYGRKIVSLAENAGTEKHRWLPRTGDVGVWHERLLHGGDWIRDMRRTRRSLVVHYRSVCDGEGS